MEVYGQETIWCRNFEITKKISKAQRTVDSKHSVWYHFKRSHCLTYCISLNHCKTCSCRTSRCTKSKSFDEKQTIFIGIDKSIEDEINNYLACQSTDRITPPSKIQPSPLPDEVLDTLNVDFLGPLPNGK